MTARWTVHVVVCDWSSLQRGGEGNIEIFRSLLGAYNADTRDGCQEWRCGDQSQK